MTYMLQAGARSTCCAYPERHYDDGHRVCAGCDEHTAECPGAECEASRALDDDADGYAERSTD
jgi:hypothetical protein